MSRKTLLIASLLLLTAQPAIWADSKKEPVAYVNPMIGTSGMGHTFPGACAPFGIVQLSPETDTIPAEHRRPLRRKSICLLRRLSTR